MNFNKTENKDRSVSYKATTPYGNAEIYVESNGKTMFEADGYTYQFNGQSRKQYVKGSAENYTEAVLKLSQWITQNQNWEYEDNNGGQNV